MLHPINPPSCVQELLELVLLQKWMLEFAEANSAYSDAAFRAFMPNEFVDWIITLRTGSNRGAKIANRFVQELTEYVKCPQPDKSQVLAEFILDQEYYNRINDPSFTFSLLPSKSVTHEKAKKCLVEFYEFLGEGYPSVLVGFSPGSDSFAKNSVVTGYVKTNTDIEYVCPCCDNAFTDSSNANEQGYTLEHYFPKSLYPSICLHPLNLIPMCSGCNSRKGDIDPLAPSSSPVIQVLYTEVFHPLSRPVRNLTFLSFSTASSVPNPMKFIAQNSPPGYENSIEAYKIMYQIPDRWGINWRRVDNRITLYVKRALKRIGIPTINDQAFDMALQEAITELEENFGKDHLNYPAAKWLAWARINNFNSLIHSFVDP